MRGNRIETIWAERLARNQPPNPKRVVRLAEKCGEADRGDSQRTAAHSYVAGWSRFSARAIVWSGWASLSCAQCDDYTSDE